MSTHLTRSITTRPHTTLLALFLAWKLLLLLLVTLTPAPGYDTSTHLLFEGFGIAEHATTRDVGWFEATANDGLRRKLVRWDAVYFVSVAERGHVYEQEWAFGWGWMRGLGALAEAFPLTNSSKFYNIILHGVLVANISHFAAACVLFQLSTALFKQVLPPAKLHSYAFIVAALHILAPAGVFLVAPYTEALFALLNFTGQLLYVTSLSRDHGLSNDLSLVLSGLFFGLAATVRGNGLLSGTIFLFDAVLWSALQVEKITRIDVLRLVPSSATLKAELKKFQTRRIVPTIVAGLLVAFGFALPQYLAFQEFCAGRSRDSRRVWCNKMPPSIFSFVQSHYWNNGFLKYWTVSNIPLFALAAPMIYILFYSCWSAFSRPVFDSQALASKAKKGASSKDHASSTSIQTQTIMLRLVLPQLALACAAVTTLHVQIINRLSSGYPVWCIVLGRDILEGQGNAKWIVRWMVTYALVQTVLYAAFLPPA